MTTNDSDCAQNDKANAERESRGWPRRAAASIVPDRQLGWPDASSLALGVLGEILPKQTQGAGQQVGGALRTDEAECPRAQTNRVPRFWQFLHRMTCSLSLSLSLSAF